MPLMREGVSPLKAFWCLPFTRMPLLVCPRPAATPPFRRRNPEQLAAAASEITLCWRRYGQMSGIVEPVGGASFPPCLPAHLTQRLHCVSAPHSSCITPWRVLQLSPLHSMCVAAHLDYLQPMRRHTPTTRSHGCIDCLPTHRCPICPQLLGASFVHYCKPMLPFTMVRVPCPLQYTFLRHASAGLQGRAGLGSMVWCFLV